MGVCSHMPGPVNGAQHVRSSCFCNHHRLGLANCAVVHPNCCCTAISQSHGVECLQVVHPTVQELTDIAANCFTVSIPCTDFLALLTPGSCAKSQLQPCKPLMVLRCML